MYLVIVFFYLLGVRSILPMEDTASVVRDKSKCIERSGLIYFIDALINHIRLQRLQVNESENYFFCKLNLLYEGYR